MIKVINMDVEKADCYMIKIRYGLRCNQMISDKKYNERQKIT